MLSASPNENGNKLGRVRDKVPDLRIASKPGPADYFWEANGKLVGIEVKWSMSDLLDSLKAFGESSGPRLAVEVRKLSTLCDIPFLVTPPIRSRGDGVVLRDDGEPTGWQYNSVKGILTDVALYGCLVDEWDGDIAARIAQLYYVTSSESHGWLRQRGRPEFITLDPTYTSAIWALCAADHIGPVTAQALLEEFEDFEAIVHAAKYEPRLLTMVKGVGPKAARGLQAMATGSWRTR